MATTKQQLKAYVNNANYEKFKAIARNDKRSASNYLELLIEREIERYEAEHGTVKVSQCSSDT